MSSSATQHNSNNIWGKLKSSSNTLQTQLGNLNIRAEENVYNQDISLSKKSIRSKFNLGSSSSSKSKIQHYYVETDGDTIDSTVVHKSLIKYYKNLKKETPNTFTGYPSWLGYQDKEESLEYSATKTNSDMAEPSNLSGSSTSSLQRKVFVPSSTSSEQLRSGYKPLSARSMHASTFNTNSDSSDNSILNRSSPHSPTKPSLKGSSSMRDRLKRR
ncbi:hypothetical protein QEN19_000972 [Hanseniaspora menglaensis]